MKKLYSFLFIILMTANGFTQDKVYIDSLKGVLSKSLSDSLKIEIYNELSWELSPIDFKSSYQYAWMALKLSKGKHPAQEATSYNRIGGAYDYHGDYLKAIENYERCYELRTKLKDTLGSSNVLINIGAAYYYQGIYNKALEYYTQSASIKEKINDDLGLAQLLNNIGLIYRVKKEHQKAISYFKQSLELKKKLGDIKGEINTLSNIGIIYQNEGDCINAIRFAEKSYQLALKTDADFDITSSLANLGFAYRCKGELKRAMFYFKEAEALLLQNEDIQTLAFCYKGMAEVYIEEGKHEQAIDKLNLALKYSQLAGRKELISEVFRMLSEAYGKLNRTDLAYKNYKQHIAYRDSVFSEENTRQLNELETIYETEQKQKQIDILTQSALIKEQQIENNRLQSNLLIVIIVSVVLLLILSLYLLRQKQHNNYQLGQKNEVIQQSLQEKEVLLKEIHHRVKNNLQIINGLLELQESLHENKEVGNLVSEAQGRIKSMALIHEMLYQTSDLSKINLEDYVKRLVATIETGYAGKSSTIIQHIDLKDIHLSIDTVIPLGLILNEIVTNAYKYVYSKNLGNELYITVSKIENKGWELIVRDNGPGIPNNGNGEREGSFGLRLVKMLSRQLKGKSTYSYNEGAVFNIIFQELNHS